MPSEPSRREWPRPIRLAGAAVVSLMLITLPGLGVWYAVDHFTGNDTVIDSQSVTAPAAPPDSATAPDAGSTDPGATDAGPPNTGAGDTGSTDPGSEDTGPVDGSPDETASTDAAAPEAAPTSPARVVDGQDLVPKPRKTSSRDDDLDPIEIVIPQDIPEVQQSVSFTVSSYNVLGFGHTTPGKARAHYGDGSKRMGWVTDAIRGYDVSVAGLQELQFPQLNAFLQRAGGEYSVYPGTRAPKLHNHVIWRNADWTAIEAHMIKIPYFRGHRVPMPYVRLQHKLSGQTVWVASFHNPADAHGNAQRWRDAATAVQSQLANRLQAGGEPVIFTGDFNDREQFICPITRNTGMRSSNGAHSDGGSCRTPRRTNVDWIVGSNWISFSAHVADRSGNLARASDHFMIRAVATLEGAVARPTNCDPADTEDPTCQGG